jgi:SAM-dependent methyltransferase
MTNWRARAARMALRITRGLDSAACSLLLGMLRPEDMKGVTLASYEQSSSYNQDRLEDALLAPLATFAPGRRMLDLGCGNGREAEIFTRAGYRVTGVDFSARSITMAREYFRDRQLDGRFIEGDFRNLTLTGQFDVIYFSPWTYAFIPGRAARIETLKRLAGRLSDDAVIVISFGLAASRNWERTRYAIARAASALTCGNPSLQPRDRLSGNLFIHFFLEQEAEEEAADAGFTVVHIQPDGPHFRTLILRRRA